MTATVEPATTAHTGVRLTEYARCAGCAAKMGPLDLKAALSALSPRADARLLVGHETFDDAAVFLLSPGVALIQTVDFFAPIVDDPYDFGRVAAANALSDVYAMGGEPLTALAITAFPTGKLPTSVLGDILRGGESIVHEAGALLVGGHTITDEEIKFGLAVTGRGNPEHLLTNAGATPGDVILLTKAIGTGILATQAKRGRLDAEAYNGLVRSMTTLNAVASQVALAVGARCATDVTGFGLLGHSYHVARASNVTVRIDAAAVPLLDGVEDALSDGAGTGGAERNERFVADAIQWNDASSAQRSFLLDPQTSGGLLVALSPQAAEKFQSQFPGARIIGGIDARGEYPLVIA